MRESQGGLSNTMFCCVRAVGVAVIRNASASVCFSFASPLLGHDHVLGVVLLPNIGVYQRWPVFWDFSTRVYGIVCDLYAAVGCAPPFLTAVLRIVFTLFWASLGIVLRYLCVCRILLLSPSDCVFIILMAPVSNSLVLLWGNSLVRCCSLYFSSRIKRT